MTLKQRTSRNIVHFCRKWFFLRLDADEQHRQEWEAEDDVKGGPLDPHEVKAARQKEIQYLWDSKVYEYSTEAEARARTGSNSVGFKRIDTNKGSAEAPLASGVYGGAS